MEKNEQKTELQVSYKAMVDAIEDFVITEGKTLQQAFHAAEEKLKDAKEISKDKIEQASKDLKDNFRMLGEAFEGAGEAYKEQIKLELAFVNSSIWDKLQSIANSNTVELIAFTKSLREQAQTIITEQHLAAHQEHSQWDSEHALWLDEIKYWTKEQQKALTKLVAIEETMQQQASILMEHTQAIQAQTKVAHEHEKIMKNAEHNLSSASKAKEKKSAPMHQHERKIHTQQQALHHKLKTHHFKIMAMINMLYKETHKAG
ncbi:hypothetical protein H4J46_06975 [Colwellia sp. MB02u-6]|uniref:zinc ribbon-containing protein n=1 Tax=Colwellia sp. MB02u-6 TaxID=2759824 RepID=UPI0015F3880B|nr:hypothetical protein [Colwellia sp. MB02u-6]MBA6327682.1 hypothetical protein [Colwellia sp. MB02u-6]